MKKFLFASALTTVIMFSTGAFADQTKDQGNDECAHIYVPFKIRDDLSKLPADKQALLKNATSEACKARIKQHDAIEKLRAEVRAILKAPIQV